MRIIKNLAEMIETARGWMFEGTVGCVVVMGPVHAGHLSLIHAAREKNEICVVCILQPHWLTAVDNEYSTASTYTPYSLEKDLEVLRRAGTDVVFLPQWQDLYPADFSTHVTPSSSQFLPDARERESASDFVTFMLKIYHLLHPDVCYFGQREWRRVSMFRRLVRDFHLDVVLVVLPTIREQNGVALANLHDSFSEVERSALSLLYKALLLGKHMIEQGERCIPVIQEAMRSSLLDNPHLCLQYVCICHAETLEVLQELVPNALLEVSVQIDAIPLTDNIVWLGDGNWVL